MFWGAVAAATWSARTEAEGRLAETNLISSTDYVGLNRLISWIPDFLIRFALANPR
jgi:hypothetical protein